jgi:hypothetical protein
MFRVNNYLFVSVIETPHTFSAKVMEILAKKKKKGMIIIDNNRGIKGHCSF